MQLEIQIYIYKALYLICYCIDALIKLCRCSYDRKLYACMQGLAMLLYFSFLDFSSPDRLSPLPQLHVICESNDGDLGGGGREGGREGRGGGATL
jgi:hypothetical protein